MKKQLIFVICLLTGISLSAMNNIESSTKIKKQKKEQTSSTTELMSGEDEGGGVDIELGNWSPQKLRRAPSMRRKITDTLLERSRIILHQRALYVADIKNFFRTMFNKENEETAEKAMIIMEVLQFEIDGLADEIQRTTIEAKQEIIELRKEHNISRRNLTIALAIFGGLFTIANLTINTLNATDTI